MTWKSEILLIIWHINWKLLRLIQESTSKFYIVMRSCSNINSSHNQLILRIWGKIILFELSNSFSIVKFFTTASSWFKTAFPVTFVTITGVDLSKILGGHEVRAIGDN